MWEAGHAPALKNGALYTETSGLASCSSTHQPDFTSARSRRKLMASGSSHPQPVDVTAE